MTFKELISKETLVVALVTAFGYVCAYLYEKSYCEYFDIPASFITIDISSILQVLILYGGVFVGLTLSLGLFRYTIEFATLNKLVLKRAVQITAFMIYLVLLVWRLIHRWEMLEIFGFIWSFSMIFLLITYLLVYAQAHTSYFGIENASDKESKSIYTKRYINENFDRWFLNRSVKIISVFLLMVFLTVTMDLKGDADAARVKEFQVKSGETPFLLIRHYGDQYLFKSVDTTRANCVGDSLMIINSQNTTIHLTMKKLK